MNMKLLLLGCFSVSLLAASPRIADEGEGWVALFDGKTLDGWHQRNGTATYTVEDGMIVGTTSKNSPNSFLSTDQKFTDFELVFEVMVDRQLNSGVMIRAKTDDDRPENRVRGPQVEIEASGENGAEAGYIYGEALDGWITPEDKLIPHKQFRDGEWNHFRILAEGPSIKVWINGRMVSNLTDPEIFETYSEGFLGLQVHGVKDRGPFEARWKDILIRPF